MKRIQEQNFSITFSMMNARDGQSGKSDRRQSVMRIFFCKLLRQLFGFNFTQGKGVKAKDS